MTQRPCSLCGAQAETQLDGATRGSLIWVQCADCGVYGITASARSHLDQVPIHAPARLNLISFTQSRSPPTGRPRVLWKLTGQAVNLRDAPEYLRDVEEMLAVPIQHASKPDDLLRLLAKKSGQAPFQSVALSLAEIRGLKIGGWAELARWLELLVEQRFVERRTALEWIVSQGDAPKEGPAEIFLTPEGWARAELLFGNIASRTCFIAMSFGIPNREEVQKAIEDACSATGWTATTVDQHEYSGPVVDKLLGEINRARFVVADFSEHKHGVYYEAGYAEGRGIPVIYTVRSDDAGMLHFDTRHLNHIVWNTPAELRERLRARIAAVINR